MNNELVKVVTAKQLRRDLPEFKSGDTVKVHVRIVEGNKERVQVFQGTVIAVKGAGISKTFTVRKLSGQVGVERTFNFYSPLIAKIEVVKVGKVRRNKLFYLRNRTGKATRVKEAA